MKYGALSVDTGTLDLSGSTDDDEVTLIWTERGGPAVESPNGVEGYGSKLLNRSVNGQLGGTIAYDWSEKGVAVVLKLSAAKLAR
jgi:two-component sensor histidine kinase